MVISVSVVLIIAVVSAFLLPNLLNNNEHIGYSYEDEHKPIEYGAVNKMIFRNKLNDVLKYTFFITDNNYYISDALLNAMSRARIPTEKMLNFADYISVFADLVMESGFSIPEGGFSENEIESEDNLFSNFDTHFKLFFELTDFNEVELSRFLYELLTDVFGDSEYGALFENMGKRDFVTLSSNTIFGYNMFKNALAEGSGKSEARALQAIIYSLGSEYLSILEKLDFDGVERLLGLNFDEEKVYDNLTNEEYDVFSDMMSVAEGKISNLIYIIGNVLTSTDAYSFELLFEYLGMDDKNTLKAKQNLVISHIELSKAIKEGLELSFDNSDRTGISNIDEFAYEYSRLMKEYQRFLEMTSRTEELTDYDNYENEVKLKLETLFDNIYTISDINIDSIENMNEEELNELADEAQGLWILFDEINEYIDNTFDMMFVNFLLKVVDVEGFLERNRRAINDLIEDSLAGLIGEEELEGIIANSN